MVPAELDAGPIGRGIAEHVALYGEGICRAFGEPWTLDGKGMHQVVEYLAGEAFGGYLDGATVAEARRWYREHTAAFVSHQRSTRPDLIFFRPQQFLAYLHRHGPIPHAAAERRKRAHLDTQRALRGSAPMGPPPPQGLELKSLADTLLGALPGGLGLTGGRA